MSQLNPDRLFASCPQQRGIARELYASVKDLPIVSPHGHTDPTWFSNNQPFANATELLLQPDHYLLRMLYSQGVSFAALGIDRVDGETPHADPAEVWQLFGDNYHLFRGTPTRMWMDHVFSEVFSLRERLCSANAASFYAEINSRLQTPEFLPRALFEQFNIEVLATTESPLDRLQAHQALAEDDWGGRVITTFRPDPVLDPEYGNAVGALRNQHGEPLSGGTGNLFSDNINELARLSGIDCTHYNGYLAALRERRLYFKSLGATATDHGHPTAATADIASYECESLYQGALAGSLTPAQAEWFRAQMLTEMALMSLDDGLVMQLHPGVYRNHNPQLFAQYGRDKGADIPQRGEFVKALKPLLDKVGNNPDFSLILFTLDETTYARELAPLAGHYPCLKLGPGWWFNDSPEGMLRYREQITETAGFYNTVGFNDDTRAFLSIPARHDMARRIDCRFLARLVAEHRLDLDEAQTLATQLAYSLAKAAYKL